NELSSGRGATELGESVLLAPDLQRPLPDALPSASAGGSPEALLSQLDQALAEWPRDGMPLSFVPLADSVDGLVGEVSGEAVQRMLWIASSEASALRDGALQTMPALHAEFARVTHEARSAIGNEPRAGQAEAVLEP